MNVNGPVKCKQCGAIYYDGGAVCPACTEHYNSVYGRTNLVGHKSKRLARQTNNIVMMFATTIPTSVSLILVLGILQAALPFVWTFYYIVVGLVIGKLIGKYGFQFSIFSVIYALTLTILVYYLADVVSIGLVNHVVWLRINEYTPSIWVVALNVWKIGDNGAGGLTIIFRIIGLFIAWKQAQTQSY